MTLHRPGRGLRHHGRTKVNKPSLFDYLPEDILISIADDEGISHEDIIALRLSSAVLNRAASAVLFRRIHISPLCRDRDSFLTVCNTPHLAQHVREIEWQELPWFPGYFSSGTRQVDDPDQIEDDDIEEICTKLDAVAADLFWLPGPRPLIQVDDSNDYEIQRQKIVQEFRVEFYAAIKQLPHVHTVLSQPMSPQRVVGRGNYQIEAWLFEAQLHGSPKSSLGQASLPCGSDGLFQFLLPAIENSALPATRLLWEDDFLESSWRHPPRPEVFRRLEVLSVCFRSKKVEHNDSLIANLNAAENLRHLSLELNCPPNLALERGLLGGSDGNNRMRWSRLQSLSLIEMPTACKFLVGIVEGCAGTLRHLYLRDCNIKGKTVRALADIPNLHLKSLRIDDSTVGSRGPMFPEDELLCFVNKVPRTEWHRPLVAPSMDMYRVATVAPLTEDDDADEGLSGYDEQDDCSDAGSEDSLDYRLRVGPKWCWGRYGYYGAWNGPIFAHQVADSYIGADHRTTCWKFTNRNGEIGFGADPLTWFEEWDPAAGDVEEPTPYCLSLLYDMTTIQKVVMNPESQAEPPEHAFKVDLEEVRRAVSSEG